MKSKNNYSAGATKKILLCCLFCFAFVVFIPGNSPVFAQNLTKMTGMDSSCVGMKTELLSVWNYPRRGEPIREFSEIALHLSSLVPCSESTTNKQKIKSFLQTKIDQNISVYLVVEMLLQELKKPEFLKSNASRYDRQVFGIVSEYYDNLSLSLFEVREGAEPKYIKITMKRDSWSQAIEGLRAQFESSETGFLDSLDGNKNDRKVSVSFEDSPQNPSLERLNAEIQATLNSRFRNPLPPKFWERRSFFRLARSGEEPDAKVKVKMELSGTRLFASVLVSQSSANARSAWLEGSLANLPEFEDQVYNTTRDMLSDVMRIYDYTLNFGTELHSSKSGSGGIFSLSYRHNRGGLAATVRLQAGKVPWEKLCSDRPLFFGLGLLPGWQFYQTERSSFDAGVLAGAGLMDASFEPQEGSGDVACPSTPSLKTFGVAQVGTFLQGNYMSSDRFSVLGRASYEWAGASPLNNSSNEKIRTRLGLWIFVGLGVAL